MNIQKIKNVRLAFVNLGFNAFAILYFLTAGLFSLSMLRAAYLHPETGEYFHKGVMYIAIRYVTFTSVAVLLWTCYRYMKSGLVAAQFRIFFDLGLHITFVWVASSELIHWMDMGGSKQSYKLGLSILWGVYSLLLIAYGIWKGKKPLRIGAIALFAVTLIKLFVYDIAHLDTISRTIVLVSLGGLLLIISFLYNKYKNIISPEIEN